MIMRFCCYYSIIYVATLTSVCVCRYNMDNQQESPIDSSTNKEETTDIKQIPESSSKMSSKTTSGNS